MLVGNIKKQADLGEDESNNIGILVALHTRLSSREYTS